MPVEGTWDLSIATPIGKITAVVELRDEDGVLTGTARGRGGGSPARRRRPRRRPAHLEAGRHPADAPDLAFDVTVDGDTLAGTSRAGRLPASKVTGLRRTDRAESWGER